MNFIEKIIIECTQQEDATGSDDIKVVKNDSEVFATARIKSGQTRTLTPKQTTSAGGEDGFTVDVGDNIKIYEVDLFDKNDLLVDYTIKAEDLTKGSILLSDTVETADYMFVIVLRASVVETNP